MNLGAACPIMGPNYHEYLLHAGSSGIAARYDEATATLKVFFTETNSFHPLDAHLTSTEELGTAKAAIVLQQPEQLRILSRTLSAYADMMNLMQDPKYEYKDILMGRAVIDEEQIEA